MRCAMAPLRFAAISMVINIVLSVALAFVIGWMAVPIGTAIAAYANAFLLWREIGARGGPNLLVETGGRIIRTILASAAVPAENLIEEDCAKELKTAETRVVPDDAKDKLAEMDKITKARNAARAKLSLARAFKHKSI